MMNEDGLDAYLYRIFSRLTLANARALNQSDYDAICAYQERFKLLQFLPENTSCSIWLWIDHGMQIAHRAHEGK